MEKNKIMKMFLQIYLLLTLNIFIHEIFHATACVLLKKEIVKIRIGIGPYLNLGKFTIGLIPLNGFVRFKFDILSITERKIIYLSGPIATIIMIIWYFLFSSFPYKNVLILQLIIHLALSLIPKEGSDFSNAFKKDPI